MPSEEYSEVVEAMRANAASMIENELSIEEQRAAMEEGFSFPLQDDISLTAVDANGVPGEWTVVPGSDPNRRLLYVHGGGYVLGSIGTHRRLVADICRASGCVALNLNYRLAPEHVFPAAVDDAIAALEYIWANGPTEPGEASAVFVGGDSAGGGLMLATLLAARERGVRMPTGGIGLSAWADLAAGPEELSAFGLERSDHSRQHDGDQRVAGLGGHVRRRCGSKRSVALPGLRRLRRDLPPAAPGRVRRADLSRHRASRSQEPARRASKSSKRSGTTCSTSGKASRRCSPKVSRPSTASESGSANTPRGG